MNEIAWGLPVVLYLFLAGLGAGSFCLGMIASKRKGEGWESCSRMAFLISPLAIFIGLMMLIIDLRYKTRFWRTLTVFNLHSPMSVGVWLLTLFFLASMLSSIFWLPESVRRRMPWIGAWSVWNSPKWRKGLGISGMPFALGVSVYTGVLLSATVIPLWRNLSLPLFFFISALSLGIEGGAILGMMSLRKSNIEAMEEPLRFLRHSYRVILPLYFLTAFLFVFFLVYSSSWGEVFHFITGWSGLIWWVGVMGIGILLPWVLVMKKEQEPMRHAWFFSGCLLLGDFLLRYVLIMAGQGVL